MLELRVRVINELGLHARAAAQLVRRASSFRSRITITRPDKKISANAKSILSILYIAATAGTEVIIEIDGPDEAEAAESIEELFLSGFGEIE